MVLMTSRFNQGRGKSCSILELIFGRLKKRFVNNAKEFLLFLKAEI